MRGVAECQIGRECEMWAVSYTHLDYVIIDAPPLGSVIDAAIIAKFSDASVMVISAKTISYKFARVVKEQLEKADCPILGVVLNKVDMKQNKYYGKYYGNYYGNYGENGKK